MLSYAYWHSHFQDDRAIVGRVVRLNKHPYTILGVAPPEFHGTLLFFSPDFYVPMVNEQQFFGWADPNARGIRWVFEVLGHLKAGVTPAQAAADLSSVGSYLAQDLSQRRRSVDLFPGASRLAWQLFCSRDARISGRADGAGGADSSGRVRQPRHPVCRARRRPRAGSRFAARAWFQPHPHSAPAIDRSHSDFTSRRRRRAVGSVMLLHRLSGWQPFPQFPMNIPVSPDANVYLVALFLALVSGLLFGIVPVRQVLRANPYEIVKAGSNARLGHRISVRDVLLVVQIAICAVLVTASLVAVRGLARSMHTNFGFDPQNVMLVYTDLQMAGYSDDKVPAMQRRMIDAMQTIPGVTSVGMVSIPPLQMGWDPSDVFADSATDFRPANAAATAIRYCISPEYLDAARTALLMGRNISSHDDLNAPHVAVVNREFARKILGSESTAPWAVISRCRMERASRWSALLKTENIPRTLPKTRSLRCFYPYCKTPGARRAWWCARTAMGRNWPQPSGANCAASTRDCLHSCKHGTKR